MSEYRISNKECRVSKDEKDFNLEDRLIDFAVRIIQFTESLPKTKAGKHIPDNSIDDVFPTNYMIDNPYYPC